MMARFWTFVAILLLTFTGIFLFVEQLDLSLLENPYGTLNAHGVSAAFIGVILLVADVILPIPSSLIMVANGAFFGIALGTVLSLVGNLGASLSGFALGHYGMPRIAHFISREESARAHCLLERWGVLAVILTRPVPLLAETTAIVAGMSRMKWHPFSWAALAGTLPGAVLYAITGATSANLGNTGLAFGLVLLIAGLFWIVGRHLRSDSTDGL
jgi:uncharacterized membrane protein YdjX (TVP38/TMEM64 family)